MRAYGFVHISADTQSLEEKARAPVAVSLLILCWESNKGPLQESCMLLPSEPSLQPHIYSC